MLQDEVSRKLQGALLRIRGDHPFFGTLALFSDLRLTSEIATAGTDGRVLWFNPVFVNRQNPLQLCGLIAHELLHAALQHGLRRRGRDPKLWNIAADIVVNGIVRGNTSYVLPSGSVEEPALAQLSVEEVYERLLSGRHRAPSIRLVDLIASPHHEGSLCESDQTELHHHWRAALQQAAAVARRIARGFGHTGLDAVREITAAANRPLDWQELLWQFMVSTPFDFASFDRRFIYRGLYLEDLAGATVQVALCIDTSGSIASLDLGAFMSEVDAILDSYPQIQGHLFYADTNLYGPHDFSVNHRVPTPRGGGGTSFLPFFDWIHDQQWLDRPPLAIYLTDGHGDFPDSPPASPVLWVVSPGGLDSSCFPFGEVIRMGI